MVNGTRERLFLATAVPALAFASARLSVGRWPRYCAVPQREYLARSPWRAPTLVGWMLGATALSGVFPAVVARTAASPVSDASAAITFTLLAQVGLEGVLGLRTDRTHPLVGGAFSVLRIAQTSAAATICDRHGRAGAARGMRAQQVFWAANLVMLAVTVRGRSVRRPINGVVAQ